jgi:hypothetical protein
MKSEHIMLALQNELSLLLVAIHAVIVIALSWRVYVSNTGRLRWRGLLILVPWFALLCLLAWSDVFSDVQSILPPAAIAITIPIVVIVFLLWREGWLRRIVRSLSLQWLIGIQLYRVLGAVFLLGWLSGELPSELGLPTFILDLTIGLTAIPVAILSQRRERRGLVVAWNIVGLLDFAYSISLTLLALPGLSLISMNPSPALIGQLPLSLIAVWAVPLSIALHLFTLFKLRESAAAPVASAPSHTLHSAVQ